MSRNRSRDSVAFTIGIVACRVPMVTLQLRQLRLFPGQRVDLEDVSWQTFEEILTELGDSRGTRIAYNNKTLTIVAPSLNHERAKVMLGDLVKVLLEEMEINHVASGSTTLMCQDLGKGIEPDGSFYIRNFAQVLKKDHLDLTIDPPPDLAIALYLTSTAAIEIYEALGIPELWRYDQGWLRIDILQAGQYVQVDESPTFPGWPIVELAQRYVVRSREVGHGRAVRELREEVRSHLPNS
jgi:Uma2 family endonuclease